MEDTTITLQVNRKDFEDIYFEKGQGSLFFSSATKRKTITTLLVGGMVFVVFILKDFLSQENFGVLYFLSFIFLLCAVYLSVSVNKVSRWRKEVLRYLKTLENATVYEISFNHRLFKVNLNDQHELSEWKDFEGIEINEDYISLEGKYHYMFPRKSMSEKEYHVLQNTLKQNIKI